MESGNLYLVSTPIGNMKDITLRAIETLQSVNYIACEDTRKTGTLLKTLGINKKHMLISYYNDTEDARIPNIINLLLNGEDVALVSDSGTPTISDPGFRLVRECKKNSIKVISIPGPTALISALASSGLPTDKFIFLGFLPKKEGNRNKLLEKTKSANSDMEATVIIYEAPHRILKTIESIKKVFGNINLTILREITKIHEEALSMTTEEFIKHYSERSPKGEFVILWNTKEF